MVVLKKLQQEKLKRYVLVHSNGIEYAKTISALNFAIVDPFAVWSVFADYGEHQVCISKVRPVSTYYGDAAYAVDVFRQGTIHYVNGTAFVPCVVRDRLVDLADRGDFARYGSWLPCVTVQPALTTNGPASPFKPA